jgi:hypothetical protein
MAAITGIALLEQSTDGRFLGVNSTDQRNTF